MRRLSHRLRSRWPPALTLGGPILITAVWVAVGLFALSDASLKPHQLQMTGCLVGFMGFACVLGLSRSVAGVLFARSTAVEVDLQPARRGEPLRCFVLQQGAGLKGIEVRLRCLQQAGRRSEEAVVDLPVGASGPTGLRVQLDAEVRVPADAPASDPFRVRWCIRVAVRFDAAPESVREFPLQVV